MTSKDTPQFSLEEELLILVSRVHLEAADKGRMSEILTQELNWQTIQQNSDRLGNSALLYVHLEKYASSGMIPPDTLHFLEDAYSKKTIRNLRIYAKFIQIVKELNESNISCIVLKGLIIAKRFYGDTGLRHFSDIDMLFMQEDLPILTQKLAKLGFTIPDNAYESRRHKSLYEKRSPYRFPFYRSDGIVIDVHVHPFKDLIYSQTDIKNIWDTEHSWTGDGIVVHTLSPEYELFFLCLHLFNHIQSGKIVLYWFCDIHEFIKQQNNEINWGEFCALANHFDAMEQIYSVLNLIKSYWNTPISDKILRETPRSSIILKLPVIIRKSLSDKHINLEYASRGIVFFIEKRRSEGLKFISLFIVSHLFPSRASLQHRYRLQSSQKVWLYYPLNQFRLIKRFLSGVFVWLWK